LRQAIAHAKLCTLACQIFPVAFKLGKLWQWLSRCIAKSNRSIASRSAPVMQDEVVHIKVQPLTSEAFRPYGHMLENKQPLFPEVEQGEGRVAIELLQFKRPVNPRRISMMATHFSYNQTFIPVRGTMALIVAPAPRNRSDGHERYEIDYDRLAAFFVEPGQAAFIEKGVWHYAVALGQECEFINVTRKNPGEGTSRLDDEMRMDKIPSMRPYVEVLDFRQRDRRVIELEV
jgi:ureidoglycolate hydrolase